MTTQYSPILKLALPVQGELSGTWGDVVNDNITSMVEQAIAGRAVINTWTTNSHTLTSANGTTSESRCAMLELTDTGTALSGAGTVICPTASKIYIVKNAAGQNITVKTSGGTGILVPNGRTTFLFCDGTNVVEALTHTTSLQLGTSTTVTAVLDEDNMASNSATSLATQQSIKAYVDAQVGANNELSEVLANGNTSGANDIIVDNGQKITTNTIDETTAGSGVTIDSVLLKDDGVNATNLEVTNIKANDGTAAGSIADSTGVVTVASAVLTTADINGGTADGVVIGGTTPAAATVTTATANTSLNIAGTVTVTSILDEDNMASDDPAGLATQQSIKAYVDSQVGTNNELSEVLANGNTTGGTDISVNGTDDIVFGDDNKAIFGAGSDLQIYSDGANSIIHETDGTGNLIIRASNINLQNAAATATLAQFINGGKSSLRYNNHEKLATTSAGIDVTGTVTADGLTGDSLLPLSITAASGRATNFYANGGTLAAKIASTGDISFYEDQGTTVKLRWSATNESLGIGTDSPDSNTRIHIKDANTAVLRIEATGTDKYPGINFINDAQRYDLQIDGATDSLRFYDATNTASRIVLDTGGNVGIGVTPENSGGTWRNFEQGGINLVARFSNGVDGMIGTNYVFKTDNSEVYKTSAATSRIFFDANEFKFQQAGSGTAGNTITWSEAMRIKSTGDVGIGTGGDFTVDDITGSGYGLVIGSSSASSAGIQIRTGTSGAGNIYFGDNSGSDAGRYDGFIQYSQSTRQFNIGTAQGTRFVIDSSGKVGIGNSSVDPDTLLHLEGTNNASAVNNALRFTDLDTSVVADQKIGRIEFETSDTSNAGVNLQIDAIYSGNGAGSELVIYTGVAGSLENRFYIQDSTTIFNSDGGDNNFRVQSDTDTFAFYVDGGHGGVQMGGSSDFTSDIGANGDGRLGLVNTGNGHAGLSFFRSDTSIGAGNVLAKISAYNNDTADNDVVELVRIQMASDGAFSNTDNPTKLEFYTTPDASETIRQVGYFNNTGKLFTNFGAEINGSQNNPNGDFKVSSSSNSNALLVDAGTNIVSIGAGSDVANNTQPKLSVTTPWKASSSTNYDGTLSLVATGGGASGGRGSNIIFTGEDGTSARTLAKIDSIKENSTSGDHDGSLIFRTRKNGSGLPARLHLLSYAAIFNDESDDTDFRVKSINNANMLFMDAGNDILGVGMVPDTDVTLSVFGAVGTTNGSAASPTHTFYSDPNTGMFRRGSDQLGFSAGGTEIVAVTATGIFADVVGAKTTNADLSLKASGTGAVVVNKDAVDRDFRVATDANSNIMFIDGALNRVRFGKNTSDNPNTNLVTIGGTLDTSWGASLGFENDATGGANGFVIATDSSWGIGAGFGMGLGLGTSNNFRVFMNSTETIINERDQDYDFRVESTNNPNMLFVDAGGDAVCINTNSITTAPLNIQSDTSARAIRIVGRSDGDYSEIDFFENDNSTQLVRHQAHNTYYQIRTYAVPLKLATNQVDRFIIDVNGRKIMNGASSWSGITGGTQSGSAFNIAGDFYSSRATSTNSIHVRWYNTNGQVGNIATNGSATSYNTSSDHRLKENVVYDWDATTRLKQLKPARFNFIADADTTVDGFIAHEAQAVVPESVTGTHNEVDDNGDAVMQGIDQSKLVPLLVKTIQELEARITALENA